MKTYRKWMPPVSSRFQDVHGWIQDIHSSQQMAERLIQESEADNPDPNLLDALSTAAIIRYTRCFATGMRERLSIEELPSATDADIELHKRLRGIRDWHVAHPVNQQEVHAIYIIVDESPGATSGAVGISSFSSTQLPLRPFQARAMVDLCNKWTVWLEQQLLQENVRLMPHALALSRDYLLSLPQDEPQPNDNIHARRKQIEL
jgi:hypothetical protein